MDNAKMRFKGEPCVNCEVSSKTFFLKPLAYPKVYKLGEFGFCVDYYFNFLFICKGLNKHHARFSQYMSSIQQKKRKAKPKEIMANSHVLLGQGISLQSFGTRLEKNVAETILSIIFVTFKTLLNENIQLLCENCSFTELHDNGTNQ